MTRRKRAFGSMLILSAMVLLACQIGYLQSAGTPTGTTRVATRTPTRLQPGVPPSLPVIPTVPPAPTEPRPQPLSATATANVRVRSEPSTSGAILTTLKTDQTVSAVGRNAENDWVQIVLPSDASQFGWVSAQYLSLSGPIEDLPVVQPGALPPVPPPGPNSYPYP